MYCHDYKVTCVSEGKSYLGVLNSLRHVSGQKKSRIIGEVISERGRIWGGLRYTVALL